MKTSPTQADHAIKTYDPNFDLVVKEGKSSDKLFHTIKSRLYKVLGVMTEQLKGGKHGKTSVLKLLKLKLLKSGLTKLRLAIIEISKETPVINGTDEEDHLGPSKGRDGINGSNTIGNLGTGNTGGDVKVKTVHLLDNISNHGELGNTSVLKLGGTVLIEGILIDIGRKAERIPESSWLDDSKLILVTVQGSLGVGLEGRGKGGGAGGKGGGDGELHC